MDVGVGAGVPLLAGEGACIRMCLFKLTFLSALYEQRLQVYCLAVAGRGVFASLLDSSAAGSAGASVPSVGLGLLFEQ